MTLPVDAQGLALPRVYWVDGHLVLTDTEGHVLHAPFEWAWVGKTLDQVVAEQGATLVEPLASLQNSLMPQ